MTTIRTALSTAFLLAALAPIGARAQERLKPDPRAVAKARHAIDVAARAKDPAAREKAIAELHDAPRIARFEALARTLESRGRREVRVLAANELVAMGERASAPLLVQAVEREGDRPLRADLTRALRTLADPDTALHFVRYLGEPDPRHVLRAMEGLSAFRDRRAVDPLVRFVEMTTGSFGRAAIEITTDRAYIKGWNLISGGTGLVIVEVPDPEIDIVREGVAMDVQVKKVEMRFATALLQDLTGAEIGADAGAWREWLGAHPAFELAAAQDAPPKK